MAKIWEIAKISDRRNLLLLVVRFLVRVRVRVPVRASIWERDTGRNRGSGTDTSKTDTDMHLTHKLARRWTRTPT